MKTKIICSFVLILLIASSCKKDSETIIVSRDFIEINGDKRIISTKSNEHYLGDKNMYNNIFEYEFEDKLHSKEIGGYPIDGLEFRIIITDSNLNNNTARPTNKDYPLVDLSNHQLLDYARIGIVLSKNGQDHYYFNSFYPTGNLHVSEFKGKTVFEFSNIELTSGVLGDGPPIPVSGRFEL